MTLTSSRLLCLPCLLLVLAGCSTPSPPNPSSTHATTDPNAQYRLGKQHYEDGDYDKALELSSKAAEHRAAESMYNLGVMYQSSQGLKYDEDQGCVQDFHVALEWLAEAAEQGNAEAQYYLGLMHYRGQVVPQNFQIAIKWFETAAEQGHIEAQNTLGEMYMNGQGVPQDYLKALEWFSKAAEQGNANAQYTLGRMYRTGKGIPLDPTVWIPDDNKQGFTTAQEANLGFRYTHQDDIEAYIWSKLASDQDEEYVRNFNEIAASISESDIVNAEALYQQRKDEPPPK